VRHMNDGTLRRIVDEPLAMTAADQAHFDGCQACKARFDRIAGSARTTAELLSLPAFEADPAPALALIRLRITEAEAARPPRWYERWSERASARLRPYGRPVLVVALAAALLVTATASGLTLKAIRIVQPTAFTAVQVSPSDFANARNALLDYGQVKWLPAPPKTTVVSDAASAQSESGFTVLTPSSLPKGVAGPVSYAVISQATGSLTFDSHRLRDSAARAHVSVRAMPSTIDGSTLYVNGGPALIEAWGVAANGSFSGFPTLLIAQTRVPTVDSTKATAAQLEDYVLSQPGVPPDFAAQIRAIKDPSTTLPIPIPQGFATTENVQVNGVSGLLIKTALGAGVVWVKNGVIYAVGGQVTPDQVVAIATSLH
jgi:hypothetical protein